MVVPPYTRLPLYFRVSSKRHGLRGKQVQWRQICSTIPQYDRQPVMQIINVSLRIYDSAPWKTHQLENYKFHFLIKSWAIVKYLRPEFMYIIFARWLPRLCASKQFPKLWSEDGPITLLNLQREMRELNLVFLEGAPGVRARAGWNKTNNWGRNDLRHWLDLPIINRVMWSDNDD